MNKSALSPVIEHVKRYTFLGTLTIVPVALTFFFVTYLYRNIDRQVDRLLPAIPANEVPWLGVFALFFVIYLIGIVTSYVFGKRVTKVSKRITDLFPHMQDLNKELEIAKRVHQTIIPGSGSTADFDVTVDYIPCNVIGGDFVQYHFLEPRKLLFVIGDVTGHGLPAALLTNRLHMELHAQMLGGKTPGAMMAAANDFIIEAFHSTNMYFSAFCGLADAGNMSLIYASCGHIPQYIYRKGEGKIVELSSQTTMLGYPRKGAQQGTETQVPLANGDRIVLFTDGIPETAAARNKRYGTDRLKQDIKDHAADSGQAFHKKFLEKIWNYTEQDYEDDVCLMTIDLAPFKRS
ncbi:MAG: PP2C family protein-serine/threonine phosphatase [Candidatus Omnitrophota bacterium]|nr:PP2C family protein-serine/threonine phosphatase [Candidatus Omnitrophota bacterium]